MFPRLEGPRRRNYSAPSNSMQPRGFLRMHIFMDGMRIVWRACRCSGVDATRIYSRASKRRARAIRASSLDTASPDRSPPSCLSSSPSHTLHAWLSRVSRKTLTGRVEEEWSGNRFRYSFVSFAAAAATRRATIPSSLFESISPFDEYARESGRGRRGGGIFLGDIFFS